MSDSVPKIGILTVSDRASAGVYKDASGPAVVSALKEFIVTPCVYEIRVVSDDIPEIERALRGLGEDGCCLICTTGGTGVALRDVTPEATALVCEKSLPGFGEAMRQAGVRAGVPTAILSRQTAGVMGSSLIVNLPGKPAAIRECLEAVIAAVPDALDLIGGSGLSLDPKKVKIHRPHKESP